MVDEVLALVFAGGKRLQNTIAATAGNIVTNLSPATGKRWMILRGRITLDTDANAANRRIVFQITDGTDIIENLGHSTDQVANKIANVDFGEVTAELGESGWKAGTHLNDAQFYFSIRPIVIEEADQFRISIISGLAGDSYEGFLVVLEL